MPVTFFGGNQMPTADNANVTAANATVIVPPNMQADDFVLVFVCVKAATQTFSVGVTGGQAWTVDQDFEGNTMNYGLFYCRFNGTWDANPRFDWTTAQPYIVWMAVFRGVSKGGTSASAINVNSTPVAFAAPDTTIEIVANTITTTSANTMMVAWWQSNDNNSWTKGHDFLTSAGSAGIAMWRSSGGTDTSGSALYDYVISAGGNAGWANIQSAVGPDTGISHMLALNEEPAGPAPDGGVVEEDISGQFLPLLGVGIFPKPKLPKMLRFLRVAPL